jgi:hypothetical protein
VRVPCHACPRCLPRLISFAFASMRSSMQVTAAPPELAEAMKAATPAALGSCAFGLARTEFGRAAARTGFPTGADSVSKSESEQEARELGALSDQLRYWSSPKYPGAVEAINPSLGVSNSRKNPPADQP